MGVDYFFRPRAEIEKLSMRSGHVSTKVRGDLQRLEVAQIEKSLNEGKDAFMEGNPFIPTALREYGALRDIAVLAVFVSPLCEDGLL